MESAVERINARPVGSLREKMPEGPGLIVEFVGPTGCGKTTNCQCFSDLFNKRGLRAYVFKDVKEFLFKLGIFQRLCIYLRTLLYNRINLLSYTSLLVSNGIMSFDSIRRYVKICIFNTAVGEFMKTRRVDILLLDQWIIQGLWSATIFKARSYISLQEKLPEYYFPASYVLFFDVDEETACDRIRSRESGRSRFDQMDPKTRLAELQRYNQYLKRLFENSKCSNKLCFSTKISPQKNAQDFLDHLQHTLNKAN